MRTNQNRWFITLALVATFIVALGAGSEAVAGHKNAARGTTSPPRPSVGPCSGEPDVGQTGIPSPPKLGTTVMRRPVSGEGTLTFQQWMALWARQFLKR
jgi:hypothetical protein